MLDIEYRILKAFSNFNTLDNVCDLIISTTSYKEKYIRHTVEELEENGYIEQLSENQLKAIDFDVPVEPDVLNDSSPATDYYIITRETRIWLEGFENEKRNIELMQDLASQSNKIANRTKFYIALTALISLVQLSVQIYLLSHK